jgi:hypothetical protein
MRVISLSQLGAPPILAVVLHVNVPIEVGAVRIVKVTTPVNLVTIA